MKRNKVGLYYFHVKCSFLHLNNVFDICTVDEDQRSKNSI